MYRKIIALSWHPSSSSFLISGGYKRFYEILKRCPYEITIIDRYPSLYKKLNSKKITILEYGKNSNHKFLLKIHPYIYKAVDRITTSTAILFTLSKTKNVGTIYVPFSELLELTFSAVVSKFIFNTQIVLCNLNVNTYFLDRPVNDFLHKFANKIITISKALKKDLQTSGIFPTAINGVGFEKPKTLNMQYKKEYDAIYIGRHIPQKGIFDLIEIWNLLMNKYKFNAKLVTVGDVPEYIKSNILKKISEYGLDKYIFIKGAVSDDVKKNLLLASTIMVFPSHQEGWGIAPMEGLSYQLPVVAYDLPIYQESIGQTKAFRKIPQNNWDGFAKNIIDTLINNNYYSNHAKTWKPILTWDEVAKKEWQIIKTINDKQ